MENRSIVLGRAKQRLWRQNKNFLMAICGETGSGKSYSALTIASYLDKGFTAERVCFSPLEIIQQINAGNVKRGDVLVLDEAGANFSSRDWQRVENKRFGTLLQTFRHQNLGLIFTLPVLDFMDLQGRSLIHVFAETQGIDYEHRLVKLKLMMLQYSSLTRVLYKKYPRIRLADGRIVKVPFLWISEPNPTLKRAYEKKKRAFCRELNKNIEQALSGTDTENTEKTEKPLTKKDLIQKELRYVREIKASIREAEEEPDKD
jgi:hypothetical protein